MVKNVIFNFLSMVTILILVDGFLQLKYGVSMQIDIDKSQSLF